MCVLLIFLMVKHLFLSQPGEAVLSIVIASELVLGDVGLRQSYW